MNTKQEERLVAAWEGLARGLGELNEIVRTAVGKQWPEAREPREAIVTRLPSAEDKLKAQTGNTDGPVEDWLGEFDAEEEIGPRERAWRESHDGQAKSSASSKANTKASGSQGSGT